MFNFYHFPFFGSCPACREGFFCRQRGMAAIRQIKDEKYTPYKWRKISHKACRPGFAV
ncbi:hypothetical protein [Prevotella sp. P3-122]|uniref:hypothetical protein n=1 Tax=Prevotella sp. P3-122 TaxID=2024223 RepID=UPI00148327B3|nr:hypothetical protein [Prevotella sp. P3-122]